MEQGQIYVLISILALAIIAVAVFFVRGRGSKREMSRLSQMAFVFIFAGIIFSNQQFLGYGLMTFGGILAIIDIVKKFKNKK